MGKICLVLREKSLARNRTRFDENRSFIDLVELRVDSLLPKEWKLIPEFIKSLDLPTILTVRRKVDGGDSFKLSEEGRIKILSQLIEAPFAYVDLEDDLLGSDLHKKAKRNKLKVIGSFHDFKTIPNNCLDRMKKIASYKVIVKAAVTINNYKDLLKLYLYSQEMKGHSLVVLGMGEIGAPSRILVDAFSSLWSYASLKGSSVLGQFCPEELDQLYRIREKSKSTKIFGIIGNPVSHSLSPQIHNDWFSESGKECDAIYIPFKVENLKEFVLFAKALDIRGLSVTIPHKENIVKYLDVKEPCVEEIGASNTVYLKKGKWIGTNTDAHGFIVPLLEAIKSDNLKGRRVTVIGAGGASVGIIYALKKCGAEILLLNRSQKRGRAIAGKFSLVYAPLEKESASLIKEYNDIIIQTTPVGMKYFPGDPIPFFCFEGKEVVYDIIYKPVLTDLLKRAKKAGCFVLNGSGMLKEQAKKQALLFREAL